MYRYICGKSKKGVSLIEEICAVFILVIGVVAVISVIGLARTSVLGNSTEEAAAAKAQEISDALISALSRKSTLPETTSLNHSVNASYMGDSENDFAPYSAGKERQFVCIPTDADSDGLCDGYRILSRVYYNGGKDYVQMMAYTTATSGQYNPASSEPTPTRIAPVYKSSKAAGGIPYLLYGTQYSDKKVLQNSKQPGFLNGSVGTSSYPVVLCLPAQNSSGNQGGLDAPSVFFMGGNTAGTPDTDMKKDCSIYLFNNSKAAVKSDFIYIASNAIAFKANQGEVTSLTITPHGTSKSGYLYFAKDCSMIQTSDDTLGNQDDKVIRKITAGLYQFTSSQNILDSKCVLTLSPNDLSAVKTKYNVDYIQQSYQKQVLVSGETQENAPVTPYNGAAGWTKNGVLQNGVPSGQSGKDVYLYVNSTSGWDSTAQTYKANRVALQYVNPFGTLTIPAGKSVTFQANTVCLNGQTKEGDGDFQLTLMPGSDSSKFVIDAQELVLYHTLAVKNTSGATLYHVAPGTYHLDTGTYPFNLFDTAQAAKAFQNYTGK